MLVNVTGAVPLLVTVTDIGELLDGVFTVPKFRLMLAGLKLRVIVTDWPVPLRGTTSGLPVALLVIESDAEADPKAEGVNVT